MTDFATVDRSDLLSLTAALVAVPSVSRSETSIADAVEARLRARAPRLEVDRVGDNVVARTRLGRDRRVVLAGHHVRRNPGRPRTPKRWFPADKSERAAAMTRLSDGIWLSRKRR